MQKRFTLLLLSFCFSLNAQPVFDHVLLVAATGNGITTAQAEKQLAFMQSFLYDGLGFDNRNLNILKGADASKENITTAIQRLKQLPKNDRVFIYFLGNSYAFDTEASNVRGFFLPTELRLDEILNDTRMYKGKLVRDAVSYLDMQDLIAKMEMPNLTLMLDTNAAGLGETFSLNLPPFQSPKKGHGILYLNTGRGSTIKFENDLTAFSQHFAKAFQNCQDNTKPRDIASYFSSNFATAQVRVYGHSDIEDVTYPCLSANYKAPIIEAQSTPNAHTTMLLNLPDGAEVWKDGEIILPNSNKEYTILNQEQAIYMHKKGYEPSYFFTHPQRASVVQKIINLREINTLLRLDSSITPNFQLSINQIPQIRNDANAYPLNTGLILVHLQEGSTRVSSSFTSKNREEYNVSLIKNATSAQLLSSNLISPVYSQLKRKDTKMAAIVLGTASAGIGFSLYQNRKFNDLNAQYNAQVLAYTQATTETTTQAAYEQYTKTYGKMGTAINMQRIGFGILAGSLLTHIIDSLKHSKIPLSIKITRI